MKIEAGKIYKNRDGEIFEIKSIKGDTDFPFVDGDGSLYTEMGKFYLERDCEWDLIEEVITGENMNDYERKIADLENRIAELESRLIPCDGTTAEPVKWSPVGGNWWISRHGIVGFYIKKNEDCNEFCTDRPTEYQAERASVEMRKFNRLLALRDELGAANWVIGKTNYYIYYDYINGNYRVCTNSSTQIMGAVYFTSQESVKKACDMLNSGEVEL